MSNSLSRERVLLGIEFHLLADTELQRIIGHAAGALQAIEDRRPLLILRQPLYKDFYAAHSIERAQVIVEVVCVRVRLFAGIYPGHMPPGMQRRTHGQE